MTWYRSGITVESSDQSVVENDNQGRQAEIRKQIECTKTEQSKWQKLKEKLNSDMEKWSAERSTLEGNQQLLEEEHLLWQEEDVIETKSNEEPLEKSPGTFSDNLERTGDEPHLLDTTVHKGNEGTVQSKQTPDQNEGDTHTSKSREETKP